MRVLGCLGFYRSYYRKPSMLIRNSYLISLETTHRSSGPWNTSNYSVKSKRDFRRTRFSPYQLKNTRFTSMLVLQALVPAQSWSSSSLKGKDCFLQFQNLKQSQQKTPTLHRELCGIVSALQTYEHFVIG